MSYTCDEEAPVSQLLSKVQYILERIFPLKEYLLTNMSSWLDYILQKWDFKLELLSHQEPACRVTSW
jgi:hypothetical protein